MNSNLSMALAAFLKHAKVPGGVFSMKSIANTGKAVAKVHPPGPTITGTSVLHAPVKKPDIVSLHPAPATSSTVASAKREFAPVAHLPPRVSPWDPVPPALPPITRGNVQNKTVHGSAFADELSEILFNSTKIAAVLDRIGKAISHGTGEHATELAGLGLIAAPVADSLQAHLRSGKGEDSSKKQLFGDTAHHVSDLAGLGALAGPSALKLMRH